MSNWYPGTLARLVKVTRPLRGLAACKTDLTGKVRFKVSARYEPPTSAATSSQQMKETQAQSSFIADRFYTLISIMTVKTVLTMVRITPECEPGSG